MTANVRVTADEHAPADLWATVATSEGFQAALVDAVRELLTGTPHYRRVPTLLDAGVTAGEGGYARLLAGLERAPDTDAYTRALDVTRQFGQGEVTPFGPSPDLEALTDGPLAALDAVDAVPTIAVRIGQAFRDRRREQRARTCRLLSTLATTCRVTVVATGFMARWLAREHGETLPRSFSEQCNTGEKPDTPVADLVAEAREQFDPDGSAVRILRDLAREPAETLSYHELTALSDRSDSRVSQLLRALEDLELIERYGPRGDRRVDLLPAGRALVETLDEETGRQQRLDDLFSENGQCDYSAVLPQPLTKGSPDAPGEQPPGSEAGVPYRTRYLNRPEHVAAAAAASDGDIVAVETPTREGDHRTRYVSYDADRDEAVVSVRATTPLQYMVSLALGLASPRLFDKALPLSRLEGIEDPPAILRDARCIGGLSNEAVDDAEILRDRLISWGEDLAEMTRDLHREEYDDRDRFRGEILRSAHGLAGSIVHLLDVAGVDVVREIRTPSLTHGQMEQLARTVAVSTAIQSKYGAFATYRQLFEERDEKRESALSPAVDATDPVGGLIGSLVLRGPRAHLFGSHVEGALSSPGPIHEDAPEFAVRVTVTTPDRPAYTAAVNRMLSTKGIRATPEAVTLFQALAGDVYAVTEAIHWLGREEDPRTIRLDEVRVSLARLDADRLLPDAPPSVSKAVAALLRSARPLSRSDLADAADVSTRSLRRHLKALVALDVVRETDAGYRLALPFSDSEHGETVAPAAVTDDTVTAKDLAFELVLSLLPVGECGRLGDPEDPLGRPFFGPGFNPGPLQVHLPRSNPYLSVALSLCNRPKTPEPSTVAFGPNIEQESLAAATTPAPG